MISNIYPHIYPYSVFRDKDIEPFVFTPVTVFYGNNGSGKSTLLKIISEIYVPEKGKVTIDGKLVSFIELGVGFNPELTGRENVYMNGAMLGFSTEEVDAMYDDIVDLLNFMIHESKVEELLKWYAGSSGFLSCYQGSRDILILDEVLAVGDEAFQRKCNDYFMERKHLEKQLS